MPVPKLKSSELLDEAIAIFSDVYSSVDPSIRGRLKREAEMLTKTEGASNAWQVLGVIATYDRDINSIPIYFKNALSFNPTFSVVSNFATAWQRVYDHEKAILTLENFLKKNPYHINCLKNIAEMASLACMYEKEVEVLTVLEKLLPDDEKISDDLKVALRYREIAHDHRMTDATSAQAISFVMNFVRDNGFCAGYNKATILEDEYDRWISYGVSVNTGNRDRIIQLNLDLCDAMAELENGHLLFNNGLSVSIEAL